MAGNYYYATDEDGFQQFQFRHDKMRNSITIHEDLAAGIAVRTAPASFMVTLGNTLWTEASPFTVWKAQPRNFAWEYLPFEVEQPIARYYEYNIAKGEKEGRAAWNKRPFNGLNIESINLPWDLYANFVYGTFERFDNFEREFIDLGGDLGYADGYLPHPPPSSSHGFGDSYRHAIHGRLAKSNIGNLTLGLNYIGINYKDDVLFAYVGNATDPTLDAGTYLLLTEFRGYDTVFFKQPHVFSMDLRGAVNERLSIHGDLAFGFVDTVKMIDTVSGRRTDYEDRTANPQWYDYKSVSRTNLTPAAYLKLNYQGFLPTEVDLAYISPGFYSPFSFATPIDAFFAYGTNMFGAGKFVARGEGSPYTQNMTGANLTFNPKLPGYGHLRFKYGHHMNITEDGRDLLFYPLRLNGADMFTFFHSSFNRWGNGLIDNSVKRGPGTYRGRLGDESFVHMTSWNDAAVDGSMSRVAGPGAGGLRSDFLSMYAGFVPYRSAEEAAMNFLSRHGSTHFSANQNFANLSTITNQNLSFTATNPTDEWIELPDGSYVPVLEILGEYETQSSWVPTSRKHTFNFELSTGYDVSRWVGYDKDLFFSGFIGLNGITRGFSGSSLLAFNEEGENTLLHSLYLRFEPAIALRTNFYLLGLFGFENWRSNKSWMMVTRNAAGQVTAVNNPTSTSLPSDIARLSFSEFTQRFVQVPINSRDFSYGLGFDWGMLARVGLHGRVKWMSHEDRGLNDMYKIWEDEGRREDGTSVFDPQNITRAGSNDWSTWVISLEAKTWF
jgi:hypothetical protein